MKNIVVILTSVLFCTFLYSQNTDLPSDVNNAFKSKFPKAKNMYWTVDKDIYKIEFETSTDTYTTLFSNTGQWIETAKVISDMDVPQKVISALNKKHPGNGISFSELVENNKGNKFFRINMYTDNSDYVIDISADGAILHEEKHEDLLDEEG